MQTGKGDIQIDQINLKVKEEDGIQEKVKKKAHRIIPSLEVLLQAEIISASGIFNEHLYQRLPERRNENDFKRKEQYRERPPPRTCRL